MRKEHRVEGALKYRGYNLTFNEFSNEWQADDKGEEIYGNEDIKKVKAYIDKLSKGDFDPIEVYYQGRWRDSGEYTKVTVTSIDEEDNAWIRKEDNSREKINRKSLYLITPENDKLIMQIKDLKKQIETLDDHKDKAEKKLKTL